MKRTVLLLLTVVVSACSVVAVQPAPGPAVADRQQAPEAPTRTVPAARARRVGVEAGPSRRFEEVRGLWVVRTTMTSAEKVRAMVEQAHGAGFNTLLVQVRGRGDAFYRSRWEPRAETLDQAPVDFDPLALVIEEAHSRDMAVHAWVNTHLVWGPGAAPASPLHLVNARPDWLAVPQALGRELWGVDPFEPRFVEALRRYARDNPNTVEGLYTSPSHAAAKGRVYDVWMDLAERYELDGIHFDYVRFPSGAFDYSKGALQRFRAWVSPRLTSDRLPALEARVEQDPYAFVEALPGPWDEFRRSHITDLVESVYTGVKARRPDILVSAAVMADAEDAFGNRYQDWRRWLDEGLVDVVVPMAYTTDTGRFGEHAREATVSAGRGDRVWMGIGAYLDTLDGTLDKIDVARGEGIGGLILFSYDWAAHEGPAFYLQRVGRARFGR